VTTDAGFVNPDAVHVPAPVTLFEITFTPHVELSWTFEKPGIGVALAGMIVAQTISDEIAAPAVMDFKLMGSAPRFISDQQLSRMRCDHDIKDKQLLSHFLNVPPFMDLEITGGCIGLIV
jgi:hypothetical protein